MTFQSLTRFPSARYFTLIGCIDEDDTVANCFAAGASHEFTAQKTGNLFFFANDVDYAYWNNSGSVSVTISEINALNIL